MKLFATTSPTGVNLRYFALTICGIKTNQCSYSSTKDLALLISSPDLRLLESHVERLSATRGDTAICYTNLLISTEFSPRSCPSYRSFPSPWTEGLKVARDQTRSKVDHSGSKHRNPLFRWFDNRTCRYNMISRGNTCDFM